MPQIDVKNMYAGSYFLSNKSMYFEDSDKNVPAQNTTKKIYTDLFQAEQDFNNNIIKPNEIISYNNRDVIFIYDNDGNKGYAFL